MSRISLFLSLMSLIYLSAYSSLLIQAKGLYGDKGILPVKLLNEKSLFIYKIFSNGPSFVNFALLVILGTCLSGLTFAFSFLQSKLMFLTLWFIYLILYQMGQTFLWFQWDILLLEIGFICIFLPKSLLFNRRNYNSDKYEFHGNSLILWSVKWLLFRFMFASGVVKLQSDCPTWWGLTALHWHYESQCIPTAPAWFAAKLPGFIHQLSVVSTFLIEIGLPVLFFVPFRMIQLFSFYAQLLLQVAIIITGNYNFFNFLTIVMCLVLLPRRKQSSKSKVMLSIDKLRGLTEDVVSVVVISGFIYKTIVYFDLRVNWTNLSIDSKVNFNRAEFDSFMDWLLPLTIYIGGLSFIMEFIRLIIQTVYKKNLPSKFSHVVHLLFSAIICCSLFSMSLIPFTSSLNSDFHKMLPRKVMGMYRELNEYQIVNSYGLFRRMTGVGGRPEIIIEGADSPHGKWTAYEFKYKPGNLSVPPPFLDPHQARLDWQMWFAALGNYNHNPWLINLVYRLLTNEASVLQLLETNPFSRRAPKFIRINLYLYHYTSFEEKSKSGNWWKREYQKEYLPVISLDNESVMDYIENNGLDQDESELNFTYEKCVSSIIDSIDQSQGHLFIWKLLLLVISMRFFNRFLLKL